MRKHRYRALNIGLMGAPGWKAHNHEVKRLLGQDPSKHWPDEGVAEMTIQGYKVRVNPKGTKGRRAQMQCPWAGCGRWVCIGHYDQHFQSHR